MQVKSSRFLSRKIRGEAMDWFDKARLSLMPIRNSALRALSHASLWDNSDGLPACEVDHL